MPDSWRRFLMGLLLFLAAGAGIGWLYGRPVWGLLVAALVALGWQVQHLLRFERALRTRDFGYLSYGDGIWAQLFSRYRHIRKRGRKHKRSYQQLLKEVRKSTNAMPDGAVVVNADDEILMCNAAARDLAGFDRRLDRGQRVDNILRDPKFIRYLRSGDYATGIDIVSPLREGEWLNCRIVPYGAEQRLLLIRDITERKRLAMMRREFVANASHELRSPLTVITGYLDTLADDPGAPPEWQQPLEQMRQQAARMTRIVSELLELSRLEGTSIGRDDQDIDVPALLQAAAQSQSGEEHCPAISVQADSRARLRGNAGEIETLIRNLLSNAVRHTPGGGSVELSWSSGPEGAELTVTDTGEGIAGEHIPRLTERFFRIDQGRSRDDGGVGLGLAIVKHILSRHDGELEVESKLGEGSRFTCRFPAERLTVRAPVPLSRDSRTA